VFSRDGKSLTVSDYNDKIYLLGVTYTLTATLAISGAGSREYYMARRFTQCERRNRWSPGEFMI
jgi:hypothetical protein